MLSGKRIRLMTKLALLEKHKGEELCQAKNYFRSDYISVRMFKNGLRITVAFLAGFLLWGCCHLDEIMQKLNTLDIWGMVYGICVSYGFSLVIGLLLTYITATRSYFRKQKELQMYRVLLERLEKENER